MKEKKEEMKRKKTQIRIEENMREEKGKKNFI
jgi:hypothetical protein